MELSVKVKLIDLTDQNNDIDAYQKGALEIEKVNKSVCEVTYIINARERYGVCNLNLPTGLKICFLMEY